LGALREAFIQLSAARSLQASSLFVSGAHTVASKLAGVFFALSRSHLRRWMDR
jgi:hypothetical protein